MVEAPSSAPSLPPAAPKIDRAALLGALYQYLASRLESVGRRTSLTMVFLGSFLAFATSPILRGDTPTPLAKVQFALVHPSILIGVLGMAVLLWSEIARIRSSGDLFTKIAFTDAELPPLHAAYTSATIDALFGELMTNIRVVGKFLRKKVLMYNIGCVLFVLSVVLFTFGF